MADEAKLEGFRDTCNYNLIYVFDLDGYNDGLLKIGKATLDNGTPRKDLKQDCAELNSAAKTRIDKYSKTLGFSDKVHILHTRLAIDKEGKSFTDKRVHKVLENSGIDPEPNLGGAREWFRINEPLAREAVEAAVNKKLFIKGRRRGKKYLPVEFREEQNIAIDRTVGQFQAEGIEGKQFLWNAKMRFGKTLCAMEVVRRMKFQKTIIATHLPVIKAGWFEDFDKIFTPYEDDKHIVGSKGKRMSFAQLKDSGNPFVYFASIQDLRGSKNKETGKWLKNEEIFNTDWDLVIIDEAHFGTTTPLGEDVINALVKQNTCRLSLSGTPFNIMERYNSEETFVWDYVDEQRAKEDWDKEYKDEDKKVKNEHFGESNPYEELPRLNIWTYSIEKLLSKIHKGKIHDPVREEYVDVADRCFNFKEFFKTDKNGEFIHDKDVTNFLELLHSEKAKTYPYSSQKFRFINFLHTLWVVPGVKEAKALEKKLNNIAFFDEYEIINVAGPSNSNTPLKKVRAAIARAEKKESKKIKVEGTGETVPVPVRGTITISCGRLTMGVTIPEWTAVLYLSGSYDTSIASYLQTIFRVQTPGSVNGREKKECYAFDFAPGRVLSIYERLAELKAQKDKDPRTQRKTIESTLKEYTNYLPIISFDGSSACPIDERRLLEQVKQMSVVKVMKSGFTSQKLFKADGYGLYELTQEDIDAFKKIGRAIKGKSSKGAYNRMRWVKVPGAGLTGGQTNPSKEGGSDHGNQPGNRTLTPEQKQQIKNHDIAISILRDVSARIPLLVFGAGAGEADDKPEKDFFDDPENFPDKFDDDSWKEFMGGVSKDDFKKTVARFFEDFVFKNACLRIRERAKEADSLPIIERIGKIVRLHSEFKNPDKETVLTPWRVVNRHLGDTLGGYSFYDKNYEHDYLKEAEESGEDAKTLFRTTEATAKTLENPDAKILEINSKTGLYPLYVAYSLMRARLPGDSTAEEQKRVWKEIVEKNLFIICRTKMAKAITRRTLLGFDAEAKANIRVEEKLAETANRLFYEKKNKKENEKKNKKKEEERLKKLEKFLKEIKTWEDEEMKFDAIIGNPPYQKELKDTTDDPIYHYFVELAMSLNPKYISLIIPSRWMTASGSEMDSFRQKMLSDTHIDALHDFVESSYVFPGTSISGGICFFRWNREHKGKSTYTLHDIAGKTESVRSLKTPGSDIFIRYQICADILEKVQNKARELNEPSFVNLVSSQTPFRGLFTNFFKKEGKSLPENKLDGAIVIWGKYGDETTQRYAPEKLFYNEDGVMDDKVEKKIKAWKFFIPYANGSKPIGAIAKTNVIGYPTEATKNSACTQTFLLVGPFASKKQTENAISYLKTKTFRLLVGLRKITPYGSRDKYSFVPRQDFSEPWTDERLFKKYKFTEEERDFIKKMIAPMR